MKLERACRRDIKKIKARAAEIDALNHGSILIRNSGYGALAWTVALMHRDTQVFAVEADNDKHLIASHTSYIPDNLHFVSEGEVLPECDFTMDNQDFMK